VPHVAAAAPSGVREAAPGIVALTAATFVAITTEALPVGLLPAISRALDEPAARTGLLVTVYALMVALLAVPLTVATRHVARKPLLVGTLGAFTASSVLVAAAPSFGLLAAGRALGGVAHALFFSVSIAYASRIVAPRFVGRAMSLVALGGTAGFVVGVPLLTSLGNAAGWRVPFVVMTVASALTVLVVVVLLRPVEAVDPEPAEGSSLERRRRLAVVSVVTVLVFLGHFTAYTYVAVLLEGAGAAASAIGPLLLALGAVGIAGTGFAAGTLDRRPRVSVLVTVGAMVAGLAGVAAVYPRLGAVVGCALVWCAGYGAVPSVTQAAAVRLHAVSADLAGALVNSTSNVGIAGGAALGAAVLSARGVATVPLVAAGLLVVAGVVVLVARSAFPSRVVHAVYRQGQEQIDSRGNP
jgi:predicted MFS family arabinose efflux permease